MNKLPLPTFTALGTFQTCLEGIGNADFKARLENCSGTVEAEAAEYNLKALRSELYTIPHIPTVRGLDQIVVGDLKKSELRKVYSQYMVPESSKGWHIYDSIKVQANDKCPFCGGIGQPNTLDHYLPKANYPVFSVHPANLIPSCRDCNTGKNNDIALEAGQQILHPYFDDDYYFNEKWVYANIIGVEPVVLEFYVSPPDHWDQISKERVVSHFTDFKLAKRYRIQAAEELSSLIDMRNFYMIRFTEEDFKEYLLSLANGPYIINHWRRVMYQALYEDENFYSLLILSDL